MEVIFSRDGTRAYASQMQSASVFEIDTRNLEVRRRLGGRPCERQAAAGMPNADTPRSLWPTSDGARLLVANFGENVGEGNIEVIDLASGESETFFSCWGAAMRHILGDERRGLLFTGDTGQDCVFVTDMKTLKTRKIADVDSHPNTTDISPDGRVLFVSCRGRNNPVSCNLPGPEWGSVLLFDTGNGKPLDTVVGSNQQPAHGARRERRRQHARVQRLPRHDAASV